MKFFKRNMAKLALAAGLVASTSLATGALAQETIKIGAPFNVTGALSSLDAPALNGAKLKAKEINDAGGINGKQIELVIYDTKTDPTVIASTASQLLNQDKVPVAIGFTDSDFGAGARADLPAGRRALRDARRHLAEASRPDRRHASSSPASATTCRRRPAPTSSRRS